MPPKSKRPLTPIKHTPKQRPQNPAPQKRAQAVVPTPCRKLLPPLDSVKIAVSAQKYNICVTSSRAYKSRWHLTNPFTAQSAAQLHIYVSTFLFFIRQSQPHASNAQSELKRKAFSEEPPAAAAAAATATAATTAAAATYIASCQQHTGMLPKRLHVWHSFGFLSVRNDLCFENAHEI